jgi:hypothetical protein
MSPTDPGYTYLAQAIADLREESRKAIDSLRDDGRRRDDKLDRMLDRLDPLPVLIDDVAEMKPKVEHMERNHYRAGGIIALVSMSLGIFGLAVAQWIWTKITGP